MKIKNIITAAAAMILSIFAVTGCGKDNTEELNQYKADLTAIYEQINTTAVSINSIDVNAEAPEKQLLVYIDDMKSEIRLLASLKAPEGYTQVTGYATEALSSITQSSTLYHEIYDAEGYVNYDETKAGQAYNFYTYTISKLNSIGLFLYGETLSGNAAAASSNSVSGN